MSGFAVLKDGTIFTITKNGDKTCVEKAGSKEDVKNFVDTNLGTSVAPGASPSGTAISSVAATTALAASAAPTKLDLSKTADSLANIANTKILEANDAITKDPAIKEDNIAIKAADEAIKAAEEAIKAADEATEELDKTKETEANNLIQKAKAKLSETKPTEIKYGGSRSEKKNKTCKKKGGKKHKKSLKQKKAAKKC